MGRMEEREEKKKQRIRNDSLEERLHNGDIDWQVSILRKVLSHGGLKDEAVSAGDDAGYALVDASRLCLPRQLPVAANQLQLIPARERNWSMRHGSYEQRKEGREGEELEETEGHVKLQKIRELCYIAGGGGGG